MKNKIKTSTLILGIIIAVLALSNASSYADTSEPKSTSELKPLEVEMLNVIEQVLQEKQQTLVVKESIKIYNNKSQLIYESRDQDDQRLITLVRRSDLICSTDTSSYYLLDD